VPKPEIDVQLLSRQWLRALRGKRSQVTLSRRLGYRTNVAYRWEAGQCFPTAARTFELIGKLGTHVDRALQSFVHLEANWCRPHTPASREGVARLLRNLHGHGPVTALAARAGVSRYRAMRWLNGNSEPTLPDFLTMIHATSGRLLDFIACFTDPETLPCASRTWRELVESRDIAYRLPWSHAVLRALELEEYQALPRHDSAWLAARLGAPEQTVDEALAALERVGQVHCGATHYKETAPETVDTRVDPERARQLKEWWAKLGVQRLSTGAPGLFSFNLSAVSRRDLERLQQIQRRAYREMSQVIAESKPAECVVLHSAMLLPLDGG
jgi:transcriptional regulator with XRE-family HTH domain